MRARMSASPARWKRIAVIVLGLAVALLFASVAQSKLAGPSGLTAMDYVEIEQLNAAYGHYIDTGEDNGAAWARLFTEDAVFTRQNGDKYVGRERLTELGRIIGSRGPKAVSHFATNVWIQPSAEGATGKVYAAVLRFPDDKMDEQDPRRAEVSLGARYHDVYVRTPQGWRFKSRTVVMAGSDRTSGTQPKAQ